MAEETRDYVVFMELVEEHRETREVGGGRWGLIHREGGEPRVFSAASPEEAADAAYDVLGGEGETLFKPIAVSTWGAAVRVYPRTGRLQERLSEEL